MSTAFYSGSGVSLYPPTLLDSCLPDYEFQGSRTRLINASPARIFPGFREFTLDDIPIGRALGNLRYLPGRLTGKAQNPIYDTRPFIDIVLDTNRILYDEPDREIVIGVIGKFHQLRDQQPVPIQSTEEFLQFSDPAYQKLVQSLRVDGGDDEHGYWVTFEHRTHALSETARRQFSRYWLVINPTSGWLSGMLLDAVKRRAETPE